jgi:hypothetical protein
VTVEALLTSVVVSAVVTSIIGPGIFYLLKAREDRKQRQFERNFGEFKHYLRALEDVSRFSGDEFEAYMSGPARECMEAVLAAEDEAASTEALITMNREMQNFTTKLFKSFRQATSELHGLRLICSQGLFKLVSEFVSIQEQMLQESIAMMGQIKFSGAGAVTTPPSATLINKGKATKELFERIVQQMRVELGTHEP